MLAAQSARDPQSTSLGLKPKKPPHGGGGAGAVGARHGG